eukprot:TRINITY_DN37956_c0_g1_i1.p1 TRINITY_DN37956_c0_g1~~TRINITY_DN37956_c0_g1_i1.p1  ORF type:complete len:149 (-),score=15.42 TRINITY_DN37956_c0_g1_i1:16-462(-)
MSTMGRTAHTICTHSVLALCFALVTSQGGLGNQNQFIDFGQSHRQAKALLGPGGHALHAHVALPGNIGNRGDRQYQDLSHGRDDFSQGDYHDIGHHEEYQDSGYEEYHDTGHEEYHDSREYTIHESATTRTTLYHCTKRAVYQLTEQH